MDERLARGGSWLPCDGDRLRAATTELLEAEAAIPIAPRLVCNDATQEKLAVLLHAAEMLQDAMATEISAATVARAICIGEYLLVHAQIALVFAFSDPVTLEAEHILAWFRTTRTREITARDLFCVHKGR